MQQKKQVWLCFVLTFPFLYLSRARRKGRGEETQREGVYFQLPFMTSEVIQSCPTLCNPQTGAYQVVFQWDSSGKNTGVGCRFLLQGIFLTQGLNPGFLHYRQMLYCLSHQGSPFTNDDHLPGPSQNLPHFNLTINLWVKWGVSCSVVSDSWRLHGLQPPRLLCPWDIPGKSTGVGCHFFPFTCYEW